MWFTENAWPPMLIAGLAALVCLALWNSNRRRLHLVAAFVCLLLCAGFYFLERAIVTEGERLQQIVVSLCDDFRNKRVAETVNYFSDAAPELKVFVQGAMVMVTVHDDLRLTDFSTNLTNQNSRGTVHFRANATLTHIIQGNVGHFPARFVLTFRREKGEWKIIEVERLNPLTGERMQLLATQPG
ncbi:MAG: hypothetical protein H7062_20515 [Candidatus Saccharimonas sp.]|nr:hypothetical protein [Planctomycetaceae bacterium]